MTDLDALLLGFLQGLTEFLPVSSSGHLVIGQALLGIRQEGVLFEITVHVATLVSVLIFYRKRVVALAAGCLRGNRGDLRYVAKLGAATLPVVAVVLALGDWLEGLFESEFVAAVGLLITGGILWTTRHTADAAHTGEPAWSAALWMGCAQAVSLVPGISRSGATVATGLALGVAPAAAAEFSFLMSAVAIAGAALRATPGLLAAPASNNGALALGGGVALLSGIVAIWLFVRLLRSRRFYRFAYYVWGAGGLMLVWLALR